MRGGRPVKIVLLAIGLAVLLPGLALRIYMGSGTQDRVAPQEAVSIFALRSPLPKASFLVCPPGYCSAAEAVASPIFDMPWERLRDYWLEMISGEARVIRADADLRARRYVYIQHSPILRFPDIITVELIPLDLGRSSIAVYSRSRYGEYDFHKNRKRVEKWLFLLQKVALPAAVTHVQAHGIGIGGRLGVSPLPHHRAYGSVPRRFDRVKPWREHRGGEDRGRRNTGCAGPVGRPDVRTCARNRSASRQQPLRGTSADHAVAVL